MSCSSIAASWKMASTSANAMRQRHLPKRACLWHILFLWLGIWALLIGASGVVAQAQPAQVSLREVAAFLGAMPLPEGSSLSRLTQTAPYQKFAKTMQHDWAHFERVTANPMRQWGQKWLPEPPTQTVLYPFAGPDFLNAYLMYPKAKQYVLIGLEHGGDVPDLINMEADRLAKGLTTFRSALKTLMYVNFFVTKQMEVDIDQAPIPGVTPVVLAAMARLNLEPLAIRPVQVNMQGNIDDVSAPSMTDEKFQRDLLARLKNIDDVSAPSMAQSPWHGYESVEVLFRSPEGEEQRLIYLAMDLSDKALKAHPHWVAFYQALGEVSGLIKAGSYLMHSRNFSMIRNIMLQQAQILVQDDSGLPSSYLNTNAWMLQPFGVYTAPLPRFKDKAQPSLRELYAKGAEPLPFPWGYGNTAKQTNLLLVRRKPQL
jgi:hypothetical protein